MAAFQSNTNGQEAYWPDSYPDASTLPAGMMTYFNPNFVPNSAPHLLHQHEFTLFPQFETEETEYLYSAVVGSKFLEPAQQLLHKAVNVEPQSSRSRSRCNDQRNECFAYREVSFAGKLELQSRLMKLCSMLEEVERRYGGFKREMESVTTSFDAIAGCGSGKQYTSLVLHTISKQFRSLRDAITAQIAVARRMIGEEESADVAIPRLRHVEWRFKEKMGALQKQQSWRPQRGLPESSVSILRAWLFEHFLHPYPRDSDKIILARQAGLTRSQVSNWFINARVRLWKPMVEEMYRDERREGEMDSELCTRSFRGEDKKESELTEEDGRKGGFYVSDGSRHGVSLTLGLHQWSGRNELMECVNQGSMQPNGFRIDQLLHDFGA